MIQQTFSDHFYQNAHALEPSTLSPDMYYAVIFIVNVLMSNKKAFQC